MARAHKVVLSGGSYDGREMNLRNKMERVEVTTIRIGEFKKGWGKDAIPASYHNQTYRATGEFIEDREVFVPEEVRE